VTSGKSTREIRSQIFEKLKKDDASAAASKSPRGKRNGRSPRR
jgi:hypothetical protein